MGGIIAKIDSNNKVINIEVKNKSISNEEKIKLINYYNKYGTLKVKINYYNLDLLIKSYLNLLSKNNYKLEESLKNSLKMGTGISILMISNMGLAMLLDDPIKMNPVEGFENTVYFENFEEISEQFVNIKNSTIKTNKSNNKEIAEIIIPKILLSNDKKEFVNFISKLFADDDKSKIIFNGMNNILDKIVSEKNDDLKIANLISIVMRTIVISIIITETKKVGPNNFSKDDEIKFISHVFLELLTLLPTDRCIFNEHNVFEFSPNVCNIKKAEKCPKAEECKKADASRMKDILIIVLLIITVLFIYLYFNKK